MCNINYVEERPWGSFEVLLKEDGYQVKRLTIKSGHGISLQYHKHRSEHWVVVHGKAYIINGDEEDNRVDNLVFLCPNCHTQTKNSRGKNYGRRKRSSR